MLKDRIKEARNKLGLTQKKVAEQLGIAPSTYTGYETGNSTPDMYKLALIMRVLCVDANYLLQDEMAAVGARNMSALACDEKELLSTYRDLNVDGQKSLLKLANMHAQEPSYTQDMSRSAG